MRKPHFDNAMDTPWQRARRRFTEHRWAPHGLAVLMAVVLADAVAPQLRDGVGGGPLIDALHAGHTTLAAAVAAALAGALGGLLWGVLAAALGGPAGRTLARTAGWLAALPLALLPVLAAGMFGADPLLVELAVAAALVPPAALSAHAVARAATRHEFLTAARAAGLGSRAILWRHTLPNALGPLLAALWPALPQALAIGSLAAFLGLGGEGSWGAMIGAAADWYALLPPGVLLVATLAALHAVGAGIAAAVEDRP